MRSWSFIAFPHCATSQFYTTTFESDTGVRYSLLWSQGCKKKGCIVPYSDQSPLVHHTYDGYSRGSTLLTLKQITEVLRDHSFPEGNPAHKLRFTV